MSCRSTLKGAKHWLWLVSVAFVLGGIWSDFSFYFGLTLFYVWIFA